MRILCACSSVFTDSSWLRVGVPRLGFARVLHAPVVKHAAHHAHHRGADFHMPVLCLNAESVCFRNEVLPFVLETSLDPKSSIQRMIAAHFLGKLSGILTYQASLVPPPWIIFAADIFFFTCMHHLVRSSACACIDISELPACLTSPFSDYPGTIHSVSLECS